MEPRRPDAPARSKATSTDQAPLPPGSGDYTETLALANQYRQRALSFEVLRAKLGERDLTPHPLGCDYLMIPVPAPPPGMSSDRRMMPKDWEHTWGEVAMAYWLGVLTRDEYDRLHATLHTQCRAQGAVTRAQAADLAKRALAAAGSPTDLVLLDAKTEEREFGWVFHFAPKKYLETHDPRYMLPGLGPAAVERIGGSVTLLTTSVHPTAAIAELERRWRSKKAPAPRRSR